jgi:membrane protease YdiL (CAAX protease family)
MASLIALILLPLAIIGAQMACGASGGLANSFYKLSFILGPIVYCRWHGIGIARQLFKWQNWRHGLPLALVLGAATAGLFLAAYALLGDRLLDKAAITAKIHEQFSVNAATVLLIAPFTIVINSLIEEFFYRGFAFNLLAAKSKPLGTLLPAGVFTAQHLLFVYHWVTPLPLGIGIVALTVFALVLQAVYAKTDSIVAPWLIHVCGDVAMMAIAMTLVF